MNRFLLKNPLSFRYCLVWGAFFLFLFFSPQITKAQPDSPSPINMTGIVGLDGFCMYDRWMPVRVVLENTGADLDGRVEVSILDGLTQFNYEQIVPLPTNSRKEVTLFVFVPISATSTRISFKTENEVVSTTTRNLNCIQTGTNLVGVFAATPSVYNIFTTLNLAGNKISVAQLELADFPSHPEGLDMLSMLVISDMDTGGLSEDQRQSLATWIESGGRLIVTGGPGWQKTVAGIGALLPITPTGTNTFSHLNGLQIYSTGNELPTEDTVVTLGDAHPTALILASQDNVPLILRHKLGFGDVIFLAADPALPPLRNWAGLEAMYQSVFATPLDIPTWTNGFSSWYEASTAVTNVPGLGLPSIFLICGFLAMYILALGPLNYLVLRQLKRRELAWITIPVLVLVFSFATFLLGLVTRGTRAIVNHLAIVQVWPGQERASVHGLVGVFSPNRDTYNVEIKGDFLAHPMIDGQLAGTNTWQFLQQDNGAIAEDVRIDVGGLKAVAVSGQVQGPEFGSSLTMNVAGSSIDVQGQVENNSQLSLKDAVIVGPGQVQKIGDFNPGDRQTVNLNFPFTSSATPNFNASPLPSYAYDTTLNDFFGTSYIYGNDDPDLARRFYLLQAAMGYGGSRGGGIYLLGWTDTSPLDIGLEGRNFKSEHTSIYILALTPTVETGNSNILVMPPALFSWNVMDDASYSSVFPYSSSLYEGVYTFRFQLNQAIPYSKVSSLTYHLTNYGAVGSTDLEISLWDFTENQWVPIPVETWGDHPIADPEKFVGYGGEIRIQIENPFQTSVSLERSDFTLVVEQ